MAGLLELAHTQDWEEEGRVYRLTTDPRICILTARPHHIDGVDLIYIAGFYLPGDGTRRAFWGTCVESARAYLDMDMTAKDFETLPFSEWPL